MLNQNTMILDIGDIDIKIIVGNNKKVSFVDKIRTPEDAVVNNNIEDIEVLIRAIEDVIRQNNLKVSNVVFVIKGQDVIIRHTDVPIMEYNQIGDSAKWEINQYLPQHGDEHYVNFQIIDRIKNADENIYKLIVAAAPREKIDKYVELAKKLGIKLLAIDVAANCVARVFSSIYENDKTKENIAIIKLGNKESNIVILEKGRLFVERELPFGIDNIKKQIMANYGINQEEATDFLKEKIELTKIDENNENEVRLKRLFDNVFSSFQKVIQFFGTGRSKKKIDKIYVIDSGADIINIDTYIQGYLDIDTSIVNSPEDIFCKFPDELQFKEYITVFGALIRKGSNDELNLIPYDLEDKRGDILKGKKVMIITGIIVVCMLVIAIILKLYIMKLNSDNNDLKNQINKEAWISIQNTKLNSNLSQYNKQITTASAMQKSKVYVLKWIEGIVKQLPSDVTTDSIVKDSKQDNISITGGTQNINSVTTFANNLKNSGLYKDIKIISINQGDASGYKFAITVGEVVK
ncbi:pilus assembly protein PilM [Clostridium akagii]|uniref:pilus assembly protein PilM n=1 Tax=Clostridium akagii TaxID=91623 RepID=UPI0006899B90|nr:pilus assembly protein PilM [Clostridium akagii]